MATAFICIAIVMAVFILNAIQETSSRLAWSFARDNGLIFSKQLSQIHPRLQVPVYALLLTYGLLAFCGCIFVASTTGMSHS
jgi:choline transport protein